MGSIQISKRIALDITVIKNRFSKFAYSDMYNTNLPARVTKVGGTRFGALHGIGFGIAGSGEQDECQVCNVLMP